MEFPEGLKYSKEHEWVLVEGTSATIGITEYAQEELGDIVFVELPEVGEKIVKDDPFGAVESVKAVSDIYAPVSGAVVETNEILPDNPETINDDPYGDGWMVRVELSDIYAPVSGAVVETNEILPDNPETINDDPYGDGWMVRVELSDIDDLKDLMDADEYAEYVAQQKEDDDEEDDDEDEDDIEEDDDDKVK